MRPTPPLKWAGGKRWLAPILEPIWKAYHAKHSGRWVEPFSGGMSLAFCFQPSEAILNDANPHVINFFQWVQKGLKVRDYPEYTESSFYEARAKFNQLIKNKKHQSKKAASLFYYLNRTGFNGLCRFNNSGYFNVPFGRHKNPQLLKDFSSHQLLMGEWSLSHGDFAQLHLLKNDFLYIDPPYDSTFQKYHRNSFGWEEQVRLAQWAKNHSGPVILSNQATERVVELYHRLGFSYRKIKAPRMISANGNRKPAIEILAWQNLHGFDESIQSG